MFIEKYARRSPFGRQDKIGIPIPVEIAEYRPGHQAGLVTGAIFSDLNGDGYPDFILTTEWGPARVFLNEHGRFKAWDLPLSQPAQGRVLPAGVSKLSDLPGLWTCVATGDFD